MSCCRPCCVSQPEGRQAFYRSQLQWCPYHLHLRTPVEKRNHVQCHRLQTWFCANPMADFIHQTGCDISDFIVTDWWISSPQAATCKCIMFHCKLASTDTVGGRWDGCQPYIKQRVSLKAPLWRANPCSEMGRVESQLEAPFSDDTFRVFVDGLVALFSAQRLYLIQIVCEWYGHCSWL